jgi:hypothetical protein
MLQATGRICLVACGRLIAPILRELHDQLPQRAVLKVISGPNVGACRAGSGFTPQDAVWLTPKQALSIRPGL